MSVLPIMADGQLAVDAGAMVLGTMLYPTDPRSARQLGALLWEETVAKAQSRLRGEQHVEGALVRDALARQIFLCLA
jgi:hypothetical protein